MKSEKRRQEILSLLGNAETAVPAAVLAERFNVSRQVIVQDIAIMRANGYDIISTNRGYLLTARKQVTRVFKCRHTFEELMEEGGIIIDAGGAVEDVFVNHRIYGSRRDSQVRIHILHSFDSVVHSVLVYALYVVCDILVRQG